MKTNQRAKNIRGSKEKPRLAVYKGLKNVYAQIIDDEQGHTLAAASSLDKTIKQSQKSVTIEVAKSVGKLLAEKARKAKIDKVVFDRRNKRYHGRIKAVAEGAREGGLIF